MLGQVDREAPIALWQWVEVRFFVLLVIMQNHVCLNCFSRVQLSLLYMVRALILSMRLMLSLYIHRKLD